MGGQKLIRKFRQSLQKKSNEKKNFDDEATAYPWLNSIFMKIKNEGNGEFKKPYLWGVLHAAYLAKSIGINHLSIIEFGVAGGNGLVSLEKIAEKIEAVLDVTIDVYGFDTGKGLPKNQDYRDLPNLYAEGDYKVDLEKLQKRLKRAKLFLGLVEDTIPEFLKSCNAPIAFVSIDLDLYSSTIQAFKIFNANYSLLLPRIHCYFDDIMGFSCADFNGERLAITDFNASHEMTKISKIYGLRHFLPTQVNNDIWADMMYMVHIFNHNLYGCNDGLVKKRNLFLHD